MAKRLLSGDAAFAILLLAGGAYWMSAAVPLGFWRGYSPGTGFLPFCYGAMLVVTSALILFGKLVGTDDEPAAEPGSVRKPVLILLLTGLALLGFETVGFPAAVFLALLLLFIVVERLPWLASLVVAAAVTATLYLLFSAWLGVPLPRGPFGV
jgi:hypothetical protein